MINAQTEILQKMRYIKIRDFKIQTNQFISAWKPDSLFLYKKKTCHLVDIAAPAPDRGIIEEKEKDTQILRSCQSAKKSREHEGDTDTNWN